MIVIYVLMLVLFLINSLFNIQMLQQNSYNGKHKYFLYILRDYKNNYLVNALKIIFLILTCLINTKIFVILGLIVYILYEYKIYEKHKEKLPLKFTKRVFRISCLNLIFFLSFSFNYKLLLTYIIFNSWILIFIVFILTPVEKIIFNSYKNKALAKLNKMQGINIIGITGSFGKTSTKMILNSILSVKYKGFFTPGSYNTPNGVVLTLNNEKSIFNDYFICEMGARKNGDIKELCDIVKPKYGIITSVGPAHLESFKSIDNVCKTKFELGESLKEDGLLILNKDSKYLREYKLKNKVKVVWVGIDKDADVMAKDIKITNKGTTFKLVIEKSSIMVNTILLGEKNIYNILESAALAYNLGLSLNEIKQGILNIKPIQHRLEIKQYNNITVIDDSFNANPEGAKNALEVLSLMEGKKIVITPGMIEMGSSQEELNFAFGKNIAEVADEVYLIGENQTKPIKNGIESVNKKFNVHVYNRFIKAYNDIIKASGNEKIVILIENDLPDAYMEG